MSAADPSVAHSVAPAAAAYMGSEPAATGHPDPEKDSRLPSALGSKEKYQSPEETLLQSSGIVVPSRTTGTKIVSSGGPYGDDLHVKRRGPFSSWKHAAAVFNFGFLISSWVFGIASPLVLAFLIWNRWFTLALVMASAMAYPLLFPVRPWPLVRWLFASVLAPHAYYQPHGWSVSFQRGALQALQRRDAGEYYRERAKRRKRAGRLVKPTAHILPSGDTAANVSVVADVDSTAAQASVSGPVASLTLGTTQLLRPESKGDDSAGERSDCEQDELDLLSPISSAVEAAAAAAADAADAVDATAAAAAAAAAGSSAKDEGAGPSSPHARRPVLAAFHPHGIFPVSFWLGGAICSELFTINPNMTFLISSALYSAPMFLFIIRWMGKFAPADAASTAALMAKGEDIGLIPGGFEEATIYRHGHHRLFLKSRRGFIKYALRYGYTVVPVYSFGEEQSYYNATCFTRLRLRLNKWQIPGVFPWGAPGVLPFSSHAMDIVYGEPLELPLTPQPSDEEVALWHGRYVERVKETFERNKARFGQPDAQLEIW